MHNICNSQVEPQPPQKEGMYPAKFCGYYCIS